MVITLTPIARSQWRKVAKVVFWVVLTNAVGILVAYLSSLPALLAIGPALNVLGVTITQVFQQAEDQAIGSLPAQNQAEANLGASLAAEQVGKVIKPTSGTPAPAGPKDKPQGPSIGSAANA